MLLIIPANMESRDLRYKLIPVAFPIIGSCCNGHEARSRFHTSIEAPMSLFLKQTNNADESAVIPLNLRRERLKFADFSFTRTQSGQCSAEVTLEWNGVMHVGRSIGQSSSLGDFRVASEATLRALEDFAKEALHFELLGVRHVRAFDANLLIVSVSLREESQTTRLVGCYLAETDTRRGAAMAVLNATNRVLGNYIATR